jgi:alpha-galactosidase
MHSTPPSTSSGSLGRPVLRLFLLLFALGLIRTAGQAAGLDGLWRIDIAKKWGVTLHSYLILSHEGETLKGTVLVNGSGRIPIRNPHVEGDETVFDMEWGWTFHVRPDGNNLHVVISYGSSGKDEVTAVPASESEFAPPAVIPPPPLHELPSNGLAQTPPMGWNSWNHFAERVDDPTVRETADAMVASGMAAAGYMFINIDDTWEAARDSNGAIVCNSKFPDMAALAAYVHSKGLKLGIYSSPGPHTCGGYEGSYGHEEQDAKTFAAWGIDYLKYDWCSAGRIYKNADLRAVYQKMGDALQKCGRPIVYSLCEYGMGEVWTWGPRVGANLWRTTGDISDNWKSMSHIGFEQGRLAPYAGPGHWNDPDMLEVGNGGMTSDEYRTHFSLWCMLSAPLMAGNDLRSMSAQTRDILTNREVIAIDQDGLGTQATRDWEAGGIEVWSKKLRDGSTAIALFNRTEAPRTQICIWQQNKIRDPRIPPAGMTVPPKKIRDLWHHLDLTAPDASQRLEIPAHGVILLTAQ